MTELLKIREVSSRYDISARALRYYEDMGLIKSTRSTDYAYRLYDKQAIKRLEQILILRKLNISIKDIQLIFKASGSEVVLEVLGKKVNDIDGEVALLQDLRDIIMEFIGQIKQADFGGDADVKRLYEKAAKAESRIANISYEGNASKRNRFLEVTDKLKKAPEVRIVQINPFKAFSSGADTVENVMGAFQQWQEAHNHLVRKMIYGSPDFLWFEEDMKAVWIWAVEDWVTKEDTAPYELIEFEGGLYAAAMSVDGDDDMGGRIYSGILKWLENSGFELDERPGHRTMGHMLNPSDGIRNALGYDQMDMYVPIKIRDKEHREEGTVL
ncbi:MAG: MerR family transcriptional regulator [Butyrivibrio sp.]|nr:MerR family transcriptional regulator [Butyrivibrio sp.]